MPINRLLAKSAFEPDEVEAMAKAFEATCAALGLSNRDEPIGQLVAGKVIECARTGERDPKRLCKLVLSDLENYASKKARIIPECPASEARDTSQQPLTRTSESEDR